MGSNTWLITSLFCLLTITGCGAGKSQDSLAIQQPTASSHPQTELLEPTAQVDSSLEAILVEIDEAPVPDGVDSQVFRNLASELRRILVARGNSQLTPHPPEGNHNRIRDLRLVKLESGSWQLVWNYLNIGDYDQNGEVNVSDLTPLGIHFGKTGPFEAGSVESLVDGDGNGEINASDITPIGMNYLAQIETFNVYSSENASDCPAAWDAQNGPDALMLSTVAAESVLPVVGQRASFSIDVEPPEVGICYWVRPASGLLEGSSSLNCGINDWSQPGHDRRNTRRSPYVGAQTGNLKWRYRTTGPGFRFDEALIGPDGTIYVGAGPELHALNPDGSVRWHSIACWPSTGPALAADGTIYIGSYSNGLYALNPDGSQKWLHAERSWLDEAPAVAPDGTIYVGSNGNSVCALDPNGSIIWEFAATGSFHATPAIADDGTIYASCEDSNLYALNPDGTVKWTFAAEGGLYYSPQVGIDGTVYVRNTNKLYALDTAGNLQWSYQMDGDASTPPAQGSDGTLYIGIEGGVLLAIDPGGSKKWSCTMADDCHRSPVVGDDGTVYISSIYHLYAISLDGIEQWKFAADETFHTSPAIGNGGTVYVGSFEDKFFAINPDGSLQWTYAPGDSVGSPVFGPDGTLYVRTSDLLFALNPDGTEKWSYSGDIYFNASPVVAGDGTVYLTSRDHQMHAVNPDGTMKWLADADASYYARITLGADGTIYTAGLHARLIALDPDGTVKWHLGCNGSWESHLAIAVDDTVYLTVGGVDRKIYAFDPWGNEIWSIEGDSQFAAAGDDGTVYVSGYTELIALNPDGTTKWLYDTRNETGAWPAIAADGTIYIGTYKNMLFAVNPDGSLKWSFQAKLPDNPMATGSTTSPAVGADGIIYVGSNRKLHAISPEGIELWSYIAEGSLSSPSIAADGTVYAGCRDGKLYAFGP